MYHYMFSICSRDCPASAGAGQEVSTLLMLKKS